MNTEIEAPRHLVIVDDSDEDAELTIRILQKENLIDSVTRFYDGPEALDYFLSATLTTRPKLILLDLDMPKMHGLEVLRQLKQHHECRPIPVVIMSSSFDDETVRTSYLLGVNGYVRKHSLYENLKEEVKQMGTYWLRTNYSLT